MTTCYPTTHIEVYGPPCSGKSVYAHYEFLRLKALGKAVEFVPELIKPYAWLGVFPSPAEIRQMENQYRFYLNVLDKRCEYVVWEATPLALDFYGQAQDYQLVSRFGKKQDRNRTIYLAGQQYDWDSRGRYNRHSRIGAAEWRKYFMSRGLDYEEMPMTVGKGTDND